MTTVDWKRKLATLGAAILLGAGGAASFNYFNSASDCCATGAACCKPGAECCKKHDHAQDGLKQPG